ncbi:MAG: hypothetical protein DDT26_01815 [Dehalococcoidia bacterium]|nr:hypothetical protein [Chloroflexota bacterium]
MIGNVRVLLACKQRWQVPDCLLDAHHDAVRVTLRHEQRVTELVGISFRQNDILPSRKKDRALPELRNTEARSANDFRARHVAELLKPFAERVPHAAIAHVAYPLHVLGNDDLRHEVLDELGRFAQEVLVAAAAVGPLVAHLLLG